MNRRYVATRSVLSAVLGAALYVAGLPWWGATLAAILAESFFLQAPGSGRYVVQQGGAAPLRRDERSRAIRDRAARNAFAVTLVVLAGVTIAYDRVLAVPVPTEVLSGVLGLAVLTYAVSEVGLRRSG